VSRWKKWKGGPCPVEPTQVVTVEFVDEEGETVTETERASHYEWDHKSHECYPIRRYRIEATT